MLDGWLRRRLPCVATLRDYRVWWLRHDVVAGLALATILVPAGMGYAQASGLPPITGLYASIAALAAYAIFGPSRILVVGPDSALIPIVATTVLPLAHGDADRAMTLAAALGVLGGLIAVLGAACRLGFVTRLLSKPIRYGYLNGIAITVILGQIPTLLGFSVPSGGALDELAAATRSVVSGGTVVTAAAVGLGCLVLILLIRVAVPRVPGSLVAVVASIAAVAGLGL